LKCEFQLSTERAGRADSLNEILEKLQVFVVDKKVLVYDESFV